MFQEEPMEMQGGDAQQPQASKYGTDAGYSEDYGAAAKMDTIPDNDPAFGNFASGGSTSQEPGAPPTNPFTQQQYETQKSSNPFK